MARKKTKNVFIGYDQKDTPIFKKLESHLSELERNEEICIWNEAKIIGGTDREKEIKAQLKKADFVLLIVSADFIASNFCYNTLLKEAVDRVNNSNARLLTILARECSWEDSPLANYTVLPDRKLPIESGRWKTTDEAYTVVAKALKALVKGEEIPYFDFGGDEKIEIQRDPKDAEKIGTEGVALYRQKKYAAALECFKKELAIESNATVYQNIGQCHRMMRQVDQAIHNYEMAIALNPDWALPYASKSRAYEAQGDFAQALIWIKEAINRNKEEGYLYANCAYILIEQKRLPEAIEQCNLALHYDPDNTNANKYMGIALRRQGRNKEALPFYLKTVQLAKHDCRAFSNLGNLYYDLGKQKLALQNYRISLKLNPDYEPAIKGEAKISSWYK